MNMNIASKSPREWHQGPGLPPAQSLGRLNNHWNHWRSEMFTEIFLSWTFVILFLGSCSNLHWLRSLAVIDFLCPTACGGMPWAPGFPETVVMTGAEQFGGIIAAQTKKPRLGGRQLRLLFFVARATKISGDLLFIGRFFETKKNSMKMDKQRGRERKSSRP